MFFYQQHQSKKLQLLIEKDIVDSKKAVDSLYELNLTLNKQLTDKIGSLTARNKKALLKSHEIESKIKKNEKIIDNSDISNDDILEFIKSADN